MRILDEDGNELDSYDESNGYVEEEEINGTYHEAQEEVQEEFHWKVIKEYPNGGQDLEKVVDVPYIAPHEAYYEKETILRYHPYTEEQLKQIADEKAEIENKEAKLNSMFDSDLMFSDLVDAIATLSYGEGGEM